MKDFRKKAESKAVNRMVTLPAKLDRIGKEARLNFSKLLQEVLAKRLGLKVTGC